MKRDEQIFNLIQQERERQTNGIELIASENFVSDQVMEAMGSVMTNKYAEGLPGKRYYGGCQIVDQSEQLAIDRVKQLFGCEWANVQPHSGAQANMAVLMACLQPGDTFMGLDLNHGGHLSHGSPVNSSGILYHPVAYKVDEETGYPAGLIAKGLLNNAVAHCHIVTTTTHKTLRGPRGGLIMLGKDFENPWGKTTPKGVVKMMSQILDSSVFPGCQGGPLEHVIAAKAVAFGEALTDDYANYVKQVKLNANAMANAFVERGYKVISNGTDNHLMLIDLRKKFPEMTGKVAENTLVKADITINKNMVPFDTRAAFQTSGIRVGTPAITTRGLKENDMPVIVEMIDKVLCDVENEELIAKTRKTVNDMMHDRPLFAW